MRIRALLGLVLGILLVFSGCAHRGGTHPTEPVKGGGPKAPLPDPVVKVKSSGADPQQLLVYQLAPGTQQRLTLEMTMTMSTRLGEAPAMSVPLPPIQMVMALKVIARDPSGNHKIEFMFLSCDVNEGDGLPQELLDTLRSELKGLEGASGWYVVSAYGALRDFSFEPKGMQMSREIVDKMDESLRMTTAAFPTVPVGIGATWESRVPFIQEGLEGTTILNCRLDSLRGTQGTVSCNSRVEVPPQDLVNDALPEGARMRLLNLDGKGQTALTFDLASLESRVEGVGESALQMKVTQPNQAEMKIGAEVKSVVSIYPTP